MEIGVRKVGAVSIVQVSGDLTIDTGASLRESILDRLDAGDRRFLLDLTDVHALDSAGLGELAACQANIVEHEGVIKLLLSLQAKVHRHLIVTGLDRAFEIFGDEAEAVTSFD